MIRVTFLFLSFIFTVSLNAAGSPPPGKAKANVDDVMSEILYLIDQDLSCTQTEDCVPVAVGARSCGGPADYKTVSKKNKNYSRIVELAQIHEALSKEQIKLNKGGMMSTCQVIMPTSAVCDKNKCTDIPN